MSNWMESVQPVRPPANDHEMRQPWMQRIKQAGNLSQVIHERTAL
jgi:hypothetical protein